mgnify:FL=1|jgi:hypothetical protein
MRTGPFFSLGLYLDMQINLDKKSGLLLGIIVGLLVIVIVLLVDKVEDDDHFVENHLAQIEIGN